MAYHTHDPTGDHPGYHSNDVDNPFFAEDDQKYASAKYDSKDDAFSGGYRAKKEEEDRKKEMTKFEEQLEGEHKPKYDGEIDDEMIKRKAAEEINQEVDGRSGEKIKKKTKAKTNIEEAIEDAVKEEKEVIHLDN